jgi:tRNA(Ile)-lysidine synthase
MEDPTNASRRHLRNRIRHDLLPALLKVDPDIESDLLAVADRAGAWRRELSALVDARFRIQVAPSGDNAALDVDAAALASLELAVLSIVWPEIASRIGLVLDRRGTRRAAEFTKVGRVGSRVQLAGGWELSRSRDRLELRPVSTATGETDRHSLNNVPTVWERWSFTRGSASRDKGMWRAALPGDRELWVRAWRPGDRLTVRHGSRLITRKVKYFLSDAGISGHIRARWPVVLAGDEIVWIPGVRRSDAATVRSGRPVVTYVCDYLDRRS